MGAWKELLTKMQETDPNYRHVRANGPAFDPELALRIEVKRWEYLGERLEYYENLDAFLKGDPLGGPFPDDYSDWAVRYRAGCAKVLRDVIAFERTLALRGLYLALDRIERERDAEIAGFQAGSTL